MYHICSEGFSNPHVALESQMPQAVLWMNIHKNPVNSQSLFGIPELVGWHPQVLPKISPANQHVSKSITITPMLVLYQLSEIQVTLKATLNRLPGSISLLKLSLLSSYSASTRTPLMVPSKYILLCEYHNLPWQSIGWSPIESLTQLLLIQIGDEVFI